MNRKLLSVTVQGFKNHNISPAVYEPAVKGIADNYFSLRFFGCKGYLGGNFFSVYKQRRTCGFIHKYALYGVFPARYEVTITYSILNRNFAVRNSGFLTVYGGLCTDFRYAVIYNLNFYFLSVLIY